VTVMTGDRGCFVLDDLLFLSCNQNVRETVRCSAFCTQPRNRNEKAATEETRENDVTDSKIRKVSAGAYGHSYTHGMARLPELRRLPDALPPRLDQQDSGVLAGSWHALCFDSTEARVFGPMTINHVLVRRLPEMATMSWLQLDSSKTINTKTVQCTAKLPPPTLGTPPHTRLFFTNFHHPTASISLPRESHASCSIPIAFRHDNCTKLQSATLSLHYNTFILSAVCTLFGKAYK